VRTAAQALERVWALGGLDFPDKQEDETPDALDDITLD